MSGLLLSEAQSSLPGHLGGIRLLEFSSDCRRFLSASLDMRLRFFEDDEQISSIDLLSSFGKTKGMDRVHDAVFSQDGSLAYVAAGLHFRCIDVVSGIELWSHRPRNFLGFLQTSPRALGVTDSGEIFVCNDSGSMELWNQDRQRVARGRSNDTPVMLSQMNDGHSFVGSDGNGLTVWDPMEMRRTMRVKWADVQIYGIAASPVAPIVAACSNAIVAIFDLSSQELVSRVPIQPGLPIIDFSPDGNRILVGQGSGVVLFDLDGKEIDRVSYVDDRVLSGVFNPSTGDVYVGLASGAVEQLELG